MECVGARGGGAGKEWVGVRGVGEEGIGRGKKSEEEGMGRGCERRGEGGMPGQGV